jgi:hypothetical protein
MRDCSEKSQSPVGSYWTLTTDLSVPSFLVTKVVNIPARIPLPPGDFGAEEEMNPVLNCEEALPSHCYSPDSPRGYQNERGRRQAARN